MAGSSILQIDEIITRFQGYVLLDRCRFDERNGLTHGHVVHTSQDRDEVYTVLRRTPNSIVIYSGPGAREFEGAFLDQGATWQAHSPTAS